MDTWNPIMAQVYVKRVPLWQAALCLVGGILIFIASMWGVTVFLFSLEKIK